MLAGALDGSTIVAPASGMGSTGRRIDAVRAVVRCSGPASDAVLRTLCPDGRVPRERGLFCVRIELGSGGPGRSGSFPAGVIRCLGPRSATSEDTLDFLLPASVHVVERLIARACGVAGVRRAGPGEFGARACLAGKMSLAQAEGVAALIAAERDDELDAAGRVASGAAGVRYAAWAGRVLTLRALVEAGVDFADQEDVVPIAACDLRVEAAALCGEIAAWLGVSDADDVDAFGAGSAPQGGARAAERGRPLVVLAGPPNAGKSTLFNALVGFGRTLASAAAGTTRDAIIEQLDLPGGVACDVADLPGLDDPGRADAGRGELDAAAQRLALQTLARADVVLRCTAAEDAAHAGHARPDHGSIPIPTRAAVIGVRTKCDRAQPSPTRAESDGRDEVQVCALDGRGVPELRRAIARALAALPSRAARSTLPARQEDALRAAAAALNGVRELSAAETGHGLAHSELIAARLREAGTALESLTGLPESPGSIERVLGLVFGRFCIGK